MTGPLAVRLLWGGLVLFATAAVLLRVLPVTSPRYLEGVAPLQMPDLAGADVPAVEYGDSGVLVGERNPFDQNGERWVPRTVVAAPAVNASPRRGVPGGIRGLVKIPGVEGVLTDDGFVSVGEIIQGARVQEVEQEEVVFSWEKKGTVTWINAERDKRRKAFEERGLHPDSERNRTP